jgi:peptidyl-prolyl cis-trans isomerase-like protein 2
MKRALGALGTQEAAEAMARGGGGKRAEAKRLLAEAKLKGGGGAAAAAAGSKPTSGSAAGGSGSAVAPAPAGGGGGDWRLRGPAANRDMPAFKPGAVTWDTEDHTAEAVAAAAAKAAATRKKKGGGGGGAPGAKAAAAAQGPASGGDGGGRNAGKPCPKEWYEAAGRVKYIASNQTTGAMSRAFTSTVAAAATKNERQLVRKELTTDKKGYARLHTSLGDVNLELHCDIAPRTCENFLALCEMGYYDGVVFHRSIKNFMIQVGLAEGWGTVGLGVGAGWQWVRGGSGCGVGGGRRGLKGASLSFFSPAPSPYAATPGRRPDRHWHGGREHLRALIQGRARQPPAALRPRRAEHGQQWAQF